ncbi:MAG: phosphatidate cytidylyltransferase [Rudaea sp.]
MSAPGLARPTPPSSGLATRVLTGAALIAAVLAALFLLPPAGFGIVVLLLVALAAREWAALIGFAGAAAAFFVGVTLLAGAALVWSALDPDRAVPTVAAACGAATLFWILVGTPSVLLHWQPRSRVARAVSGWIVLLGALVAIVSLQAHSPALALAAMASVWIADTAAYLVGRKFGRRKLAPSISPGKTWEGADGGIAAVVLYAVALLPLAERLRLERRADATFAALWIAFAIVLAALSIIGDLHESLLKREAGVKDSGTLLPGHGGLLDRIDALLAAMPPVALATLYLGTT